MQSTDLKKAGLKVTLPRMKILDLMENNAERHMKAEDIYKMLLDAGEEIESAWRWWGGPVEDRLHVERVLRAAHAAQLHPWFCLHAVCRPRRRAGRQAG